MGAFIGEADQRLEPSNAELVGMLLRRFSHGMQRLGRPFLALHRAVLHQVDRVLNEVGNVVVVQLRHCKPRRLGPGGNDAACLVDHLGGGRSMSKAKGHA